MRAGKARLLYTPATTSASRQVTPSRCICAFSTTCKSNQHEHDHQQQQQKPLPDVNVSYYDRLWSGLTPSMGNMKASLTAKGSKAPRKTVFHPPPKFLLPASSSPPQDSSTRPSSRFSDRRSWADSDDKVPDGGGEKKGSAFSALLGRRVEKPSSVSSSTSSLNSTQRTTPSITLSKPSFRSEKSATAATEEEKSVRTEKAFTFGSASSSSTIDANEGGEVEGVSWSDLLSKIQKTRDGNYPSLPSNYQYYNSAQAQRPNSEHSVRTPMARGAGVAGSRQGTEGRTQRHPRFAASPATYEDPIHDKILQTQTESRRYSLALQEEIRYLSSPLQALQWMQDRLFSSTNSDSLMSKLENPEDNNVQELQYLYGDLLVDVTNYLLSSTSPLSSFSSMNTNTKAITPSSSTQLAFLPLLLAKEHSTKSYLYGCTSKLYALNIRIKWEIYGDIQGVLELLQEMERNAVHLNMAIQDYVKNMSLAVMKDRMRAQKLMQIEKEEEQTKRLAAVEKEEVETAHKDVESVITSEGQATPGEESATPVTESSEEAPSRPKPAFNPSPSKNMLSEKTIESKLFFSNAQRRALREVEKIVVEDRRRYFEHRAREDNLNDNLVSRYKNVGGGRFASSQDNNNSAQEVEGAESGEEVSDVNALIGSYGRAIPLLEPINKSSQIQAEQVQHQRNNSDRRSHSDIERPGSVQDGGRSASKKEGSKMTVQEMMSASTASFDILNEAVSEASVVPTRKVRKTLEPKKSGTSRWSKKGKTSLGKEKTAPLTGNEGTKNTAGASAGAA